MDVRFVFIHKHARLGGLGACSPGPSKLVASEAILGQKQSRSRGVEYYMHPIEKRWGPD